MRSSQIERIAPDANSPAKPEPGDADKAQLLNPSDITTTSEIATGSFACVYKGTWRGKNVALKKIECWHGYSRPIDNEIHIMKVLTDLGAPNCVKLFGYSIESTKYSLVMEYLPNGSLSSLIDNATLPSNLGFTIEVMRNITAAVDFMHAHNIVHRDIKPDNIIFDENMRAKLCDFGLSKFIDSTVEAAGTIRYVAPEIAYVPHSPKADIFSLSVTFWEMVARTQPYATIQDVEVYRYVCSGYRETIPKECPPALRKLIAEGWNNFPDKRPTAHQFFKALNKKNIIKSDSTNLLFKCFKQ